MSISKAHIKQKCCQRWTAPNLHRDQKNTSFELQSAPNLHRDKKTKVLNFKVHQTCTGTKKTKTFQSTWEGASIPLKFLFFFVFFVPVQVWCTLKFKTFVFFVPVQVWCTLKFKTCVFLSLCRFGALWSLKPNAIVHFYCDIVSIVCKCSWHICHFLLPMQLFEGSGAFFVQRVHNLKINWTLFRTRFWFQEIGFFFLLKCQYV